MLLLNKLKVGQAPASQSVGQTTTKKNLDAHPPTPLDQLLADATGPVRLDGSDKFFGIENYGSTCYCNSIMQCLYYSAPFRENVLNFPPQALFDKIRSEQPNGSLPTPQTISTSSYPSLNSPARKPPAPPTSPGGVQRPDESKDSPEYKKRQAITVGPVLDMVQDNSSKYGMKESLFTSLRDIFEAVIGQSSRKGVVSPHRFMEILKRENEMFRTAAHQDAHEFLNLLLNQVMDSVETLAKEHPDAFPPTIANGTVPDEPETIDMAMDSNGLQISAKPVDAHWLHDLFEGHLTSETRCLTCETTSQRDEAFLDLSVDLEAHTSVTSCLHNFSKEEMLCERNKFHCDNCGGLQEAEKRMKIKRLPRILALHLKRFKYFEEQQRMQKLFHRVVYPFHLRLFNTTDDADEPDRLYELYAVVVHIGAGPYHGHYVSIIKSQDRGWLLFDDESVEPVDKSYVLKFFGTEPATPPGNQDVKDMACAYVLFYQETTLEAVLREQEAERNPASGRVSDAETAKDSVSSPILDHATTITTPIPEDVAPLEKLTHSITAPHVPILTQPVRPTMTHTITNLFTSNGSIDPALKSRKELKLEEKERKAEEKARQRTDEKFQKYTPTPSSTMDEPRNSTTTSNTSDSNNGAAAAAAVTSAPPPPPTKEKESGFSRFKAGSMSLRSRGRLFSSSNKDKSSVHLLSNSNGGPPLSSTSSSPFVEDSPVTALPFPTAANGGVAVNGVGNANGSGNGGGNGNGNGSGEKKGFLGLGRKRNGN